MNLFVYGTLMMPDLKKATLKGYTVDRTCTKFPYPYITKTNNELDVIEGSIMENVSPLELKSLDKYEGVHINLYERLPVIANIDDQLIEADAYFLTDKIRKEYLAEK